MWWTPDRIMWHERAAERCDFHLRLAERIERHLSPAESILELGCGLGRVSALLSLTHPVRAVDIEENAIECARERGGKDIYTVSDWRDVKEKADCVLCIFFGHLERLEEFSSLMALSEKKVICIYSEHRGQRDDLIYKKTTAREDMEKRLSSLGYAVESESFTLSFPQPLLSLEEAEAFITLSYPKKNISSYLPFVTESGDEEYPYTLKNEKRMVLFDIKA